MDNDMNKRFRRVDRYKLPASNTFQKCFVRQLHVMDGSCNVMFCGTVASIGVERNGPGAMNKSFQFEAGETLAALPAKAATLSPRRFTFVLVGSLSDVPVRCRKRYRLPAPQTAVHG
jgi:hypothetical protein